MRQTIYTHDEASRIIECFETVLGNHRMTIPSPEDDEREDDNQATIYGSVYSGLLDEVEEILVEILNKSKDSDVVSYEYSGNW